MFSSVASAPSIFTAFTLSPRDPSETYPIAYSLPATVDIITSVLFVILASSVVWSTLFPFSSFCSIPKSSINAPLVPDPSSLETTVISLEASHSAVCCSPSPSAPVSSDLLPHPAARAPVIATTNVIANNFLSFIITTFLHLVIPVFSLQVISYRSNVKSKTESM